MKTTIDAVAKDGIVIKAKARVTVRTNLDRFVGGATEETIIARGGEGIGSTIGSAETYNGRLYLVDEQRNQILRYSPAGLGYDDPPDEWFDPQVQANLAGGTAFTIDSDILLLMESGTLVRYSQGRQLPFSLDTSAGVTGRLSDMAISSAPDGRIYMADSSQDRILVFDKQGNYVEQLQAAEKNALQGLRGLYLAE